ncbi:OmpH family outer membrane protein [bacterium]|nr:OmpH family outer membrane protein [Candidatus Omnitrophota bacterium]MBU2528998.1 OmpH family outer membrane protein [bacterium]MBU3929845.1 OmpH family outer membrane protein [bacterium]MBU4123081.1 OmpH family outer membrane protein [bacterium]
MVKSGKKGAIALTALKFICLCFLCSGLVRAEMISTQKVAFVDIEGIYSRFRMKELAEKEMDIRREKYLSDITAMDAKIRQLETSMALEEETPVSVSISTAPDVEISTATVKTDTRGEEIKALREQKELLSVEARESLKNIKSEYMSQIMGRIYDAVAEAAEEGGYDLVIDKNNAVYGIPATDLTETVLEKLK